MSSRTILPLVQNARKATNFAATAQTATQRAAHTDVQFPNFDSYRHDSTKDTSQPARATEDDRRAIPSAALYGGKLEIY
uniref:Cytochrome b-c1 complex subunit Rieske transmembrane domain-containing protein n=1 Tax=Panagrolaimus davidi TaxID=227884 RepID=A0A914QQ20_9BILA